MEVSAHMVYTFIMKSSSGRGMRPFMCMGGAIMSAVANRHMQ